MLAWGGRSSACDLRKGVRVNNMVTVPYNTLFIILRVQVRNNHILTQNLYYNEYYLEPKYPIIGYLDGLGMCQSTSHLKTSDVRLPLDSPTTCTSSDYIGFI